MDGYITKTVLVDGIQIEALVKEEEYDDKIKYQYCSDDFHSDNKRYFDIMHTPRVLTDSENKESVALIKYLMMKKKYECDSCENKQKCMLRIHQYSY